MEEGQKDAKELVAKCLSPASMGGDQQKEQARLDWVRP